MRFNHATTLQIFTNSTEQLQQENYTIDKGYIVILQWFRNVDLNLISMQVEFALGTQPP